MVFLGVCRAYDCLPHNAILEHLQPLGVSERIFNFMEDFLRDRWFVLETCGIISTPRRVFQRAPQGSVFSALPFNRAMVAVPKALSTYTCLSVRMIINADDVAIWCVGRSTQAKVIRASVKESLTSVSRRFP